MKKRNKRVSFVTKTLIRRTTDMHTGLITEEEFKFSVPVLNTDRYSMTYDYSTQVLSKITSKDAVVLANALSCHSEYDTNKVSLTTAKRRLIAKTMDIHISNMPRLLKILEDAGVLNRKDGEVFLNPFLYWRGTSLSRAEYIKSMTVDEQDELKGVVSEKDKTDHRLPKDIKSNEFN